MPKISVLMSCYNASEYLSEAIESILNQTYTDYEFIIVNDGSTDDTLDIIKKYATQDRRIVIVDKENTGLADSLNKGLNIARGGWVARMDADDIALSTRLSTQIAFVESNDIGLLGSACIVIDALGKQTKECYYPREHAKIIRQIEKMGSPFPHSSALYLREPVITVGGYRGRLDNGAEDVDLWLRIAQEVKMACLDKVLVRIRKHEKSITGTYDTSQTDKIQVLSCAARVCHFIRSKGAIDPSQESDENNWNVFIQWLAERLRQRSSFEFQRQWSNIRHDFYNSVESDGRLRGSIKLVGGLLKSGQTFRIVQNKLFKSNLASRLADEWIQVSANRIQKC